MKTVIEWVNINNELPFNEEVVLCAANGWIGICIYVEHNESFLNFIKSSKYFDEILKAKGFFFDPDGNLITVYEITHFCRIRNPNESIQWPEISFKSGYLTLNTIGDTYDRPNTRYTNWCRNGNSKQN